MDTHIQHLKAEFEVLRNHQLYVKRSKCAFAQKKVDYLGHTITDKGVSMDYSKISNILQWPVPQSVKELKGFFGLTGYYRRFIKHEGQLQMEQSSSRFIEHLKRLMCTVSVLQLLDFKKLFVIYSETG